MISFGGSLCLKAKRQGKRMRSHGIFVALRRGWQWRLQHASSASSCWRPLNRANQTQIRAASFSEFPPGATVSSRPLLPSTPSTATTGKWQAVHRLECSSSTQLESHLRHIKRKLVCMLQQDSEQNLDPLAWTKLVHARIPRQPLVTNLNRLLFAIANDRLQTSSISPVCRRPNIAETTPVKLSASARIDVMLRVFEEMAKATLLDRYSFKTMFGALSQTAEVNKAMALLTEMRSIGLRPDESVYAMLLNCCANARDLELAEALWQDMQHTDGIQPTLKSCNNYLRNFQMQRGGCGDKAIALYRAMQDEYEETPDVFTNAMLLDCLLNDNLVDTALQMLFQMEHLDAGIANKMIDRLRQEGKWNQVKSVVWLMKRNGIATNALTRQILKLCYKRDNSSKLIKSSNRQAAIDHKMRKKQLRLLLSQSPAAQTVGDNLSDQSSRQGDTRLEQAKAETIRLLCEELCVEDLRELIRENRDGDASHLVKLLELIQRQIGLQMDGPPSSHISVNDFNTVLYALCREGRIVEGVNLLKHMLTYKKANTKSFQNVLSACMRGNDLTTALGVFDLMMQNEVVRSVVCYNSVLGCYRRNNAKRFTEAQALLRQMVEEDGILPNSKTIQAMLRIYAAVARLDDSIDVDSKVIDLFEAAVNKQGIRPTKAMMFYLFDCFAQNPQYHERVEAFLEEVLGGAFYFEFDLGVLNRALRCLAVKGKSHEAFRILEETARDPNLEPDEWTYVMVLHACGNGREVEAGTSLLDYLMERYNGNLGSMVLDGVIKMYADNGLMEEASQLFKEMLNWPESRQPKEESYYHVMNGYAENGQIDKVEHLTSLVCKKNGLEVSPTRAFNIMLRTCLIGSDLKHALERFDERIALQQRLNQLSTESDNDKILDVVSFNTLFRIISQSSAAGTDEPRRRYKQMCDLQIRPDKTTVRTLAHVWRYDPHQLLWLFDESIEWLKANGEWWLLDDGLVIPYIDACVAAHKPERLRELFDLFKELHTPNDALVQRAMMLLVQKMVQLELYEEILRFIRELPQVVSPIGKTELNGSQLTSFQEFQTKVFNLALRACNEAEQHKLVVHIYDEMTSPGRTTPVETDSQSMIEKVVALEALGKWTEASRLYIELKHRFEEEVPPTELARTSLGKYDLGRHASN